MRLISVYLPSQQGVALYMYSIGAIMGSGGLIKSEESQACFHLVESGVVAAAVVPTAGGAASRGEKKR